MRRRGLELVAGLGAALPVIVSAIHSVAVGWTALGDDAVIATRSYDVFTAHTPLLGQYSASSGILESGPQSSLGPLLYWLLAIPARLFGQPALPATIGVVSTACIVGSVVLARRRGGLALMVATALGIAVMSRAIEPQTLSDIWNPAVALLPLTLLFFTCWSIACGEHRLLPLAALLASFVMQCHLTYVAPAVLSMGVALGALVAQRAAFPQGAVRRSAVVAAVVALACWSAPLVEQAIHRPGNLVQVARSATAGKPTLGASAGWHAVVRTVGVPPWWLRAPRPPLDRFRDIEARPGAGSIVCAALVLAGLGAGLAGLRRRRFDLAAAGALGLVAALTPGLIAASTPSEGLLFISVGYTLWWAAPAGMFAWLMLGWSAAVLLAPRARLARSPMPWRAATAAGVAAVVVAGALVAGRTGRERLQSLYAQTTAAAGRLQAALPAGAVPELATAGRAGLDIRFDVEAGLLYALRRDGRRVVARDLTAGSYYDAGRHHATHRVAVGLGAAPPPGRLIARVAMREQPAAQVRDVAITLAPAQRGTSTSK